VPENHSAVSGFFQSLGADGINDDCGDDVPSDFYTDSKSQRPPPDAPVYAAGGGRNRNRTDFSLALEPETGDESARARFYSFSPVEWAERWDYAGRRVPLVAAGKLIDGRKMVILTMRWEERRNAAVQTAFFNGVGYNAWENVYGYGGAAVFLQCSGTSTSAEWWCATLCLVSEFLRMVLPAVLWCTAASRPFRFNPPRHPLPLHLLLGVPCPPAGYGTGSLTSMPRLSGGPRTCYARYRPRCKMAISGRTRLWSSPRQRRTATPTRPPASATRLTVTSQARRMTTTPAAAATPVSSCLSLGWRDARQRSSVIMASAVASAAMAARVHGAGCT
jgi:hypothetical protein